MPITLAVTDNGDGTGGVATVSGSTALSTNTLYSAPYSGVIGNLSWTSRGTRTGDGTIAVNPGSGLYFWYVENDAPALSNVTYQPLTDQTESVHYRSMLAIQQRIQGLGLAGISSSQIVVKWLPRQWEQVDTLPNIVIAPIGKEGQPGVLNNKDDIEYPCVVAIVDKLNQDYTANLARNTRWRERIFRALRHQRLNGVTEVITTDVQPDFVINPELFNKNLWYSALLALPRSREERG